MTTAVKKMETILISLKTMKMRLIDLFNLASDSKKAEVVLSVSHALSINTVKDIKL